MATLGRRTACSQEELLAKKRRQNAEASLRFRQRRKQHDHEVAQKMTSLQNRVRELEVRLVQHIDARRRELSEAAELRRRNEKLEKEVRVNKRRTERERGGPSSTLNKYCPTHRCGF